MERYTWDFFDGFLDCVCDIASGIFDIAKEAVDKVYKSCNDAATLAGYFENYCDNDELRDLLSGRLHYKNSSGYYEYRQNFNGHFVEPSTLVVKTAIQKAAHNKGLC